MKKILLSGTAIAGLAMMVATPAVAQGLSLDLGGFYRGYAVYQKSDEGAATAYRKYDFRNDTEIHFTGETTLDNGLTVGVHVEMEANNFESEDGVGVRLFDERYVYFSGGWGRVNFGKEDGAGYLLQVAAPSADSNVDGLRSYIQAYDSNVWGAGNYASRTTGEALVLDYAQDPFRHAEKITYITPKFNGFQAAVSYAPEVTDDGLVGNFIDNGIGVPNTDSDAGEWEDGWEVAARWDGQFEGVGVSLGAGYFRAGLETATPGSTSWKGYNFGLGLSFDAFSVGGVYLKDNNGTVGSADTRTWVLGAGWQNGPWNAGFSYIDTKHESGAFVGQGNNLKVDRWTVGGGYAFGPGMTFRGALSYGDASETGETKRDFRQVTFGTDIAF